MREVVSSRWVGILACLPLLSACRAQAVGYEAWAQAADDSTDVATAEAALLAPAADEAVMTSASPEEAATAAATRASAMFGSCVSTSVTGALVIYTLDACTGPYGLVTVSGAVHVSYRAGASGLAFVAQASDLDVNGGTLSFENEGVISGSGTSRTLELDVDARGTTPRGREYTRVGSYTLSWDAGTECMSLEGDWATELERVSWSTTVRGYERCEGGCPASGGSIVWSSASGSVTVRYDGSARAEWEADGRRERTGSIPLVCGG